VNIIRRHKIPELTITKVEERVLILQTRTGQEHNFVYSVWRLSFKLQTLMIV